MGYNTEFKGEILFNQELTNKQLAEVKKFLGEDCRDHPEWKATKYVCKGVLDTYDMELTYVDLEFNDDFTGLRWNGAEKTYFMENLLEMLITNMREVIPDFGFTGVMNAQGEELEDRYTITFDKTGWPIKTMMPVVGEVFECPECGYKFQLE